MLLATQLSLPGCRHTLAQAPVHQQLRCAAWTGIRCCQERERERERHTHDGCGSISVRPTMAAARHARKASRAQTRGPSATCLCGIRVASAHCSSHKFAAERCTHAPWERAEPHAGAQQPGSCTSWGQVTADGRVSKPAKAKWQFCWQTHIAHGHRHPELNCVGPHRVSAGTQVRTTLNAKLVRICTLQSNKGSGTHPHRLGWW
jgi:hypothetical protein